ncbi:MAG: hypothetical protein E7467_00795 [Ruminococcaceae bacterium]|nr:hypothetical protein [Oscillospiraceae bacterium]
MKDFSELVVTGKTELDDIDKYILCAWGTVLQCDKIDMRDMFFECGGNSLLAGEFFTLLQEEYPCLTVVDLYAYSTPEGIGECIRNKLDTASRKLESIDDGAELEDLVARYMSGELAMDELSALLDE